METLKINIPKGFEIANFDLKSGEVTIREKPKAVTERIKTVKDVLADNGLNPDYFNNNCSGVSDDERAYRILKLLANSLNEGWKPDWNNSNQDKYYPWFEMGGSSGFRCGVYDGRGSGSVVGSRLCYKTAELAKYAGTQFVDVYKQFMLIPNYNATSKA